jgi:hypothetical protein
MTGNEGKVVMGKYEVNYGQKKLCRRAGGGRIG